MESMKERLRQSFDKGGASVVHSTDTTLEAWEYIEVCFSDLVSTLEEEIRHISDNSRLSFKERLDIYPKIFRYYCKKIMNYLKSLPISLLAFCVRKFLQI